MTVPEWKEAAGLRNAEIARIVGCSDSMVSLVLRGQRKFRPDKLQKIIDASGGGVTYADEYGRFTGKGKETA